MIGPSSVLLACVNLQHVDVCQYLYTGEVTPGAVSEVGRGDVRVPFPEHPLGPHTLVAGLQDGDAKFIWKGHAQKDTHKLYTSSIYFNR